MENTEREYARTIQTDTVRDAIGAECTVDYVLPDYIPEVRRILRVEARAIPGGKYVDAGRAEFAGTVAHTVLYTDGDGKLSAVTVNGDYTFSCPADTKDGEVVAFADTQVESVACRLGGPRKMSLRSTLRSRVHLLADRPLPEPECGEGAEILRKGAACRRILYRESDEFPLADSIPVEGVAAEELRPLLCDGFLSFREARAGEGNVFLRGEAILRVLAVTEAGQPLSYQRKIPFEEEIDMPEASPRDAVLAFGAISSFSVNVSDTGEGNAAIDIDATANAELLLFREEEICPVTDLYGTLTPLHVTAVSVPLLHGIGVGGGFYTVSGSDRAGREEIGESVLDACGTVKLQKPECENGKLIVPGEIRVKLLLTAPPEEEHDYPAVFPHEFTYSFRIATDILCQGETDALRTDCRAEVLYLRPRIEPDGYSVDAELSLRVTACTGEEMRLVSAVESDPTPYPEPSGDIRVLYPEDGESLFSIGKRTHTPLSLLCRENRLPSLSAEEAAAPQSLDGVGYLLIF